MNNIEQESYEKSRSERIREARESCTKNLNSPSRSSIRTARHSYKSGGLGNFDGDESYLNPLRTLFLRIVVAIAILISIITISSMDTRYKTNYSHSIETWITSSASLESAEDFLVSILERISKWYQSFYMNSQVIHLFLGI